jgi:epoxyqueuosine reductase
MIMKKGINRREFLKVTAQGVAVTGLAGFVPISGVTAFAADSPSKEIDAAWITSLIKDYVATSPDNSLKNKENEKAWDEPLIGFASGDDPIFQFFKDDIGPFYWTPVEAFNHIYPEIHVAPADLTVIAFVLPHTEAIKADLRKKKDVPSEKWIRARFYGGKFIEEMNKHVAEALTESGYPAVGPNVTKGYSQTNNSKKYGWVSQWSERHAAYAAGLGTFGLCDGLITPVGKAIRCGSVVVQIKIPPTQRPYTDHHAYCLHYAKGTCGMCINRCPAKAVTKSGHDKTACANQCMSTSAYAEKQLGLPKGAYGCGFCQTGVPCESKIPVKI